jgi:hypothetical protein
MGDGQRSSEFWVLSCELEADKEGERGNIGKLVFNGLNTARVDRLVRACSIINSAYRVTPYASVNAAVA